MYSIYHEIFNNIVIFYETKKNHNKFAVRMWFFIFLISFILHFFWLFKFFIFKLLFFCWKRWWFSWMKGIYVFLSNLIYRTIDLSKFLFRIYNNKMSDWLKALVISAFVACLQMFLSKIKDYNTILIINSYVIKEHLFKFVLVC